MQTVRESWRQELLDGLEQGEVLQVWGYTYWTYRCKLQETAECEGQAESTVIAEGEKWPQKKGKGAEGGKGGKKGKMHELAEVPEEDEGKWKAKSGQMSGLMRLRQA